MNFPKTFWSFAGYLCFFAGYLCLNFAAKEALIEVFIACFPEIGLESKYLSLIFSILCIFLKFLQISLESRLEGFR